MTRRQRLEMVINGEITDELIAECREELKKLDVAAARASQKAKEAKSDHYNENQEIEQGILTILSDTPMLVEEIREKVAPEIPRQRISAICTNLIREGRIQSCDVKVKGKGFRKGYTK